MARSTINLRSKLERVWGWIFPTLLIALTPIFAQCLLGILNWGRPSYSFLDFVANISPHGELLIIAVALVAEAVSEVWRRQIARWQKDFFGTLCIVFVLGVTFAFSGLDPTPTNAVTISSRSVDLFVFGVCLCIACKLAGRS